MPYHQITKNRIHGSVGRSFARKHKDTSLEPGTHKQPGRTVFMPVSHSTVRDKVGTGGILGLAGLPPSSMREPDSKGAR